MENINKTVQVLDKRNDFKLVCEIDFTLANSLNVGDCINPEHTGFCFIVVGKVISMPFTETEYQLTINVVEYEYWYEKLTRILFGIKSYSYWDYYKNKTNTWNQSIKQS